MQRLSVLQKMRFLGMLNLENLSNHFFYYVKIKICRNACMSGFAQSEAAGKVHLYVIVRFDYCYECNFSKDIGLTYCQLLA